MNCNGLPHYFFYGLGVHGGFRTSFFTAPVAHVPKPEVIGFALVDYSVLRSPAVYLVRCPRAVSFPTMSAPKDALQQIDNVVLALPVPDLTLRVLLRLPGLPPGVVIDDSRIRDSNPPILGHVVGVLHLLVSVISLGVPSPTVLPLADIDLAGQNAPNPGAVPGAA